jgi:hypothetical protein
MKDDPIKSIQLNGHPNRFLSCFSSVLSTVCFVAPRRAATKQISGVLNQ